MPAHSTKVTYDPVTGTIRIRTLKRRGPSKNRRTIVTGVLPIPQAVIRTLADQLHDLGDKLDREERERATRSTDATNSTEGSVVAQRPPSTAHEPAAPRIDVATEEGRSHRENPDPQAKAPAVTYPPPKGVPHRAHARTREEAGRG